MPLQCPKCSRPNSDASKQCIYCKTSLEGARHVEVSEDAKRLLDQFLGEQEAGEKSEPKKEAAKPGSSKSVPTSVSATKPIRPKLTVVPGGKSPRPPQSLPRIQSAPPPVASKDTVKKTGELIVFGPQPDVDKLLTMRVANIMGWDKFITAQRLKADYPWIARRVADRKAAASLSEQLNAFGLKTYVISEKDLDSVPEKHEAKKIWLTNKGILFKDATRASLEVSKGQIFLAVRGVVKRARLDDKINSTGGLKLFKDKSKSDGKSGGSWVGLIVDIYFKHVSKAVRLIEGEVDFAGLGDKMTPSAILNTKFVLEMLLGEPPCAIVDESFKKISSVMSKVGGGDPLNALMKAGTGSKSAEMVDNIAHFNEHSSLMYIHLVRGMDTFPEGTQS